MRHICSLTSPRPAYRQADPFTLYLATKKTAGPGYNSYCTFLNDLGKTTESCGD